jgi:hypothetical protein
MMLQMHEAAYHHGRDEHLLHTWQRPGLGSCLISSFCRALQHVCPPSCNSLGPSPLLPGGFRITWSLAHYIQTKYKLCHSGICSGCSEFCLALPKPPTDIQTSCTFLQWPGNAQHTLSVNSFVKP